MGNVIYGAFPTFMQRFVKGLNTKGIRLMLLLERNPGQVHLLFLKRLVMFILRAAAEEYLSLDSSSESII